MPRGGAATAPLQITCSVSRHGALSADRLPPQSHAGAARSVSFNNARFGPRR